MAHIVCHVPFPCDSSLFELLWRLHEVLPQLLVHNY